MAAFTRKTDGVEFGLEDGLAILAPHALTVLARVGSEFGGVITYTELAEEAKQMGGLTTSMGLRNWIGKLLGKVVHDANLAGLPPVTSLVVHIHDGMVGEGYAEVLAVAGEEPVEDPLEREKHAAAARLACYRYFGAEVPEGAQPMLTAKLNASIARQRTRVPLRAAVTCDSCFMELPATGICSCS